jgi:hypothetical protein
MSQENDSNHPQVISFVPEPENDRKGYRPAFDDMYVQGPIDGVHIERMDDNLYWMSINIGEERQIVIFSCRGKLFARTEVE